MNRRNFLIGVSGSAVGASVLVGSGAFSRVESDRAVSIAVAEDPDAYLGLDACDSPHGEEYVDLDDSGHLYVDVGESSAGGEGVNSNSRTWFDDLIQLCNQGTDDACIWIDRGDDWPVVEEGPDAGEPRVDFYVDGDRETTILGEENATEIGVGECTCIGIGIRTHGLSEDDALLEDVNDLVTITADADGSCFENVPTCVECGSGGDAGRLSRLEIENTGSEKEIEVRQRRSSETEETVFGPEVVGAGETFGFDTFTMGPSGLSFYVDGQRIAVDHADDNGG